MVSLQSTGTDDPYLAFYVVYEKKTTRYDNGFVERRNKDLNVVLDTVHPYPSLPQLV